MPLNLPNIIYFQNKGNSVLDSESSVYQIPFYKPEEYFNNMDNYVKFVKGVEKMVRNDDRYNKYIAHLKQEVKLNHCSVLKDVTDKDFGNGNGIEMHHGPIFTLFDYCCIILEYFLKKKWKISTFRIADQVLSEHERNRIQVVMLSKSIHQLVTDRAIFIGCDQAYGNLAEFINKYGDVFSENDKDKLNRYIDRSIATGSTDYGILELSKKIYQG